MALVLLVASLAYLLGREPPPPFAFLRGKKILKSSWSENGTYRILVVDGPYEKLEQALQAEFSGKVSFESAGSIGGFDGAPARYVFLGNDKISAFASNNDSWMPGREQPMHATTYCVIGYSRQETLLDKFKQWVTGLFRPKPNLNGNQHGGHLPA